MFRKKNAEPSIITFVAITWLLSMCTARYVTRVEFNRQYIALCKPKYFSFPPKCAVLTTRASRRVYNTTLVVNMKTSDITRIDIWFYWNVLVCNSIIMTSRHSIWYSLTGEQSQNGDKKRGRDNLNAVKNTCTNKKEHICKFLRFVCEKCIYLSSMLILRIALITGVSKGITSF